MRNILIATAAYVGMANANNHVAFKPGTITQAGDGFDWTMTASGAEKYVKQTEVCKELGIDFNEATCKTAAAKLGFAFDTAGAEWHTGCLFHNNQVYFSEHVDDSTQNPSDGYICVASSIVVSDATATFQDIAIELSDTLTSVTFTGSLGTPHNFLIKDSDGNKVAGVDTKGGAFTFDWTPSADAIYTYYCAPHLGIMNGQITVTTAAAAPPVEDTTVKDGETCYPDDSSGPAGAKKSVCAAGLECLEATPEAGGGFKCSTAVKDQAICSRDLTEDVAACEQTVMTALLGAVTLMTPECAGYFTVAMLPSATGVVIAPEDLDRGILCPCMMMPKELTIPAGLVQAPELAAAVAKVGECNAATIADPYTTNVFNLGAEDEWCTTCWTATNEWTADTASALYATALEKIVAADKVTKEAAAKVAEAKAADAKAAEEKAAADALAASADYTLPSVLAVSVGAAVAGLF